MSASNYQQDALRLVQLYLTGELQSESDSDMFKLLRLVGDAGDLKVIYQLGICYHYGWGTVKDLKAAVECYARAAGLGSSVALEQLSGLRGDQSVQTDLQNAFRDFCEKANQEDTRAQLNTGYCHYWGIGTPYDIAKARDFFLEAAYQGCADAMWMLGECGYYDVGDKYKGMQGIELIKHAAELGSAEAQNELGYAYHCGWTTYGLDVEKDYKQAVEWYQKAADQNHIGATYYFAGCYCNGYGVQKDTKKTFQLYKKAALMGHRYAQDIISCFYSHEMSELSENDYPVDIDYQEAVYWNRKAVDQDYDFIDRIIPDILKFIGLTQDQIDELINQTSSFESAKTWYSFAKQYETGDGVEKSEKKAFSMYKLAARFGSTEGQVALARCYEQGIGTEKNIQHSMRWNIRAAMQGNSEAASALQKWLQQNEKQSKFESQESMLTYAIIALKQLDPEHDSHLDILLCIIDPKGKYRTTLILDFFNKNQDLPDNAVMFEMCKLVAKQDMRAVYWMVRHYQHSKNIAEDFAGIPQRLQKEAASGYAETAYSLARCHMFELGTPKNEMEAKNCYEFAVEEDHPAAQHELGRCYQDGTVVERSIYKAIELYKKAADQNYIPALKTLAEIFESDDHKMKDLNRAFQYHKRAAQLGDTDEQLLIAECYRYGRIVQKSDKDALYWHEKAAADGKHECYKYVAECYEKGIGTVANQKLAFKAYMQLTTAIPTQDNLIKVAGMLKTGTGTQKDIVEAVKYYERAGANSKLGDIYFAGNGIPRSLKTALNHYKKTQDFSLTQLLNVIRIFKLCDHLREDGLFYFRVLKLTALALRDKICKIEMTV